ncbi:energy-coupled thiamine transporter ThiT [Youxingia wuxianensis]|uniref:Energy-coupled thiamine transporter ThiT n=1 Tax=Youxingia wuxianensis TaxID=2763678 RepID=A0A926IGU1_9FIRM|nr:energy-coupled thiamine transporter ThiT [Youxingia wuxianensis]MBC8584611.1 energy-coupled thiamine transporter ThiT [Youxingia wuxianensis]
MNVTTRKLTHSALMVALATILSLVTIFKAPNGGSVTAASMVPIIIIALMYNTSWALLTSLAYSGIQMLLGFYPPPTQDFISFVLVILLDYVVAFGVLGLAGVFARRFKNKVLGACIGTIIVMALRFICHFLSGILIWTSYAPEGMPVWLYSFTYNGAYMLFEAIISVVVIALIVKYINLDKLKAK